MRAFLGVALLILLAGCEGDPCKDMVSRDQHSVDVMRAEDRGVERNKGLREFAISGVYDIRAKIENGDLQDQDKILAELERLESRIDSWEDEVDRRHRLGQESRSRVANWESERSLQTRPE